MTVCTSQYQTFKPIIAFNVLQISRYGKIVANFPDRLR